MDLCLHPVQVGEWYCGVVCRRCQEPILFAPDPSFGTKPYPSGGRRRLVCEICRLEAPYWATEFRSFRAPSKS